MTTKEKLFRLIVEMPEEEAERALEYMLKRREDPDSLEAFFALTDEIARDAPPEELNRLPTDLSYNADHYLYGAPKRS